MLRGIVIAIILMGIAWASSRWRSKDPENREGKVPPAFNYFGWGFAIFILVALIISIFMSIKST
jgi:hypothetical protein